MPWIGAGRVAGELALVAGIANRIVFLPPADRPDFYTSLPADLGNLKVEDLQVFRFYRHHAFQGPIGVIIGDRIVVAPDVLLRRTIPVFVFFPPDGSQPRLLHPISEADFDAMKTLPDAKLINAHTDYAPPDHDTGRSGGEGPTE